MKYYNVRKWPAVGTVAERVEVPCDAPLPTVPWERMTEAEFDSWRAQQATPQAAAVECPESVTRRQLLPQLYISHGITEQQIEAALANPDVIPDAQARTVAMIEFRAAYIIERQNPLVSLLRGVFGLTEPQVDALFTAAAQR